MSSQIGKDNINYDRLAYLYGGLIVQERDLRNLPLNQLEETLRCLETLKKMYNEEVPIEIRKEIAKTTWLYSKEVDQHFFSKLKEGGMGHLIPRIEKVKSEE